MKPDPIEMFRRECAQEIVEQGRNGEVRALSDSWIAHPALHRYSYHFSWLGRPIIQHPQDVMAMQEIVFATKPDLIIETGIAHGGSLIFHASMLELNALCGGPQDARVLGIDIDIREHNRAALEAHPLWKRGRISMLEGSSIDPGVIADVHARAASFRNVMVVLDSNHTHDHVLAELEAYAPLVPVGGWCIVFDTIVERMPPDAYPDRPWGRGNNPMTAADAFLGRHPEFEADTSIDDKLLISVAPRGYLRRMR